MKLKNDQKGITKLQNFLQNQDATNDRIKNNKSVQPRVKNENTFENESIDSFQKNKSYQQKSIGIKSPPSTSRLLTNYHCKHLSKHVENFD